MLMTSTGTAAASSGRRVVLFSAAALLALFVVSGIFFHVALASSSSSSTDFNNVQVFVQATKTVANYTYTISAFDFGGSLVASSQTTYPAAAFELPGGIFMFTAVVSEVGQYPTNVCYAAAQSKPQQQVFSGSSNGGGAVAPAVVRSICGGNPAAEYGFSVLQVTGASNLSISTSPLDRMPLSTLTIHVSYANGTAASGAQVSSTILGGDYWWPDSGSAVMWNQTGTDGLATLVVPSAPITINAWSWLPVNLPSNQTTIQTTVGGKKVNVTVYWQPQYVGLAGSALIMPPAGSAKIMLHAQQPTYWVQPYGVKSLGVMTGSANVASGTTFASAPTGVPASVAPQFGGGVQSPSQLSAPATTTTTTTITTGGSSLPIPINWLIAGIAVAVALGATSFGVVIARGRKN